MTKNTLSKELKNQINRALKALNLEDDVTPKELQKAFWKKFNKSASKSKRLPSGYNLFCKAKRADHTGDGKSPQDVMRALGASWKKSSKEEKDKYNNEAKAAKTRICRVFSFQAEEKPSAHLQVIIFSARRSALSIQKMAGLLKM